MIVIKQKLRSKYNKKPFSLGRICFVGLFTCLSFVLFLPSSVSAIERTFGIVAKSIDDKNFIDAWQGCNAAALENSDRCVLLGPTGAAHLRKQEQAILGALESGKYDGLAISVIDSKHLAPIIKDANVPVITFDSPLNKPYASLSQSYVGIDNFELGQSLAELAKLFLRGKEQFCLMTDMHDANLALRVSGVRQVLKASGSSSANAPNWYEWSRSPWNTSDKIDRSLIQLNGTLHSMGQGAVISVGQWPILDEVEYREIATPFFNQFDRQEIVVVLATGGHGVNVAESLLRDGLLHGYVSVDFYAIGSQIYQVLRNLSNGLNVEETYLIPVTKHFKE
ncbi:substrate-binding domain-containing protein [Halioxenophilus aromaticivorans]|uniref:substrate-binding domain-containing protein n=1 Tax=Halioxenophilus aromaticivorans TaxID=1306992 RepID=UPI0031E6B788